MEGRIRLFLNPPSMSEPYYGPLILTQSWSISTHPPIRPSSSATESKCFLQLCLIHTDISSHALVALARLAPLRIQPHCRAALSRSCHSAHPKSTFEMILYALHSRLCALAFHRAGYCKLQARMSLLRSHAATRFDPWEGQGDANNGDCECKRAPVEVKCDHYPSVVRRPC